MTSFGDDVAIAGSVVVVLTAAGAIGVAARSAWRSTVGSRRRLRSALHKITVGTPAEGVDALLGPCSLRRPVDRHDRYRQQIYVTKHADVDVYIEPELETVVAFGITVTDRRFTIDVSSMSAGLPGRLQLGRATFANPAIAPGPIDGALWWNDAGDAGYAEVHPAGNPSGQPVYVLGWLPTGVGDLPVDEVPPQYRGGLRSGRFLDGPPGQLHAAGADGYDPSAWKWFRARTTVNTLQLVGPHWPPPAAGPGLARPGVPGDVTRALRRSPRSLGARLVRVGRL